MTVPEINKTIHVSLGHPVEDCTCCPGIVFRDVKTKQHIPDYFQDLNACASFEATLQPHEERLFDIELGLVCYPSYNQYAKNHATAPQRCEAYLRVKGIYTP